MQRIEQLLMDAGISVFGGADGMFGTYTRQAVRSFQETNASP